MSNLSVIMNLKSTPQSNTSSLYDESLPGAAPTIPADVPTLPLIASQTPIFPKFIRIIEIQDAKMINLIMKNVDLKFPYAAIFCRKNDSIESALVESDDEIYKTGTFIHIQEVVPIKDSLRLLVQAGFSQSYFFSKKISILSVTDEF